MKRWSLKTSGRVLVLACVMLAGVAVNAVSQEELEAEKDWTVDEFKSFLRLPSASGYVGGFFIEGEAGPCSSRRTGRTDKVRDEA